MPTTGMSRMGRRGRLPVAVPELDTEGLTVYVPPPGRGTVYSTTGQTPNPVAPDTSDLPPIATAPGTTNTGQTQSGGLLTRATTRGTTIPTPTNPMIGNPGPVVGSAGMANPNGAAGQQGDTVAGIGDTGGMGQDINSGDVPSLYDTTAVDAAEQSDEPGATAATPPPTPQPGTPPTPVTANNETSTSPGVSIADVNALYNQYLGRDGAEVNLANWANSGMSLAELTDAIANSPEGLAYAEQQANEANDLTEEENNINDTPAFTVDQVNALYNELLGRDGADIYLAQWAASGMSLDEVREAIASSPEGVAYAQSQSNSNDDGTTDDNGTDGSGWSMSLEQTQQYVTSLYQDILGRAPRQEGLDYWVNSLMSGASAEDVIYNIFNSAEFGGRANSEISNFFITLTGESGDPSAISAYVDEARSQAKTLDQIRDEIYNSEAAQAFRARQNNNGNDGSGNVGTGEQGSVNDAINDTQTYDATTADDSADATAQEAQVTTRTVSPDELVEYRIRNLLDSNNPYIQRARTSGLQFANKRGLLNSSIAAQAAEEAAIQRAGEIAAQDAATYANAAAANQQAQNTAGLQDAQLGTNVSMFNVGEQNTINRFNAQSINEAGQFNAAAANQAIQNFLQREQVRLLQDDQQAFTAEQNEADRVLRQLLQEQQFDFTSSENALDRNLQTALQQNQFAFQGGENAADRALQQYLQQNQFDFQGGENALDRAFQSTEAAADRALQQLLAEQQIAFNEWSQINRQDWQATQNSLQLQFQYYNSNAQVSQSIMYSTMEGIAAIYADPNLTYQQKQAAIQNLMNSAVSMPQLLDTIQSNVTNTQQTFMGENYSEEGVWIGEGHPTWVQPPQDGDSYTQVITPITNPVTGQTFNAPNSGWTYVGPTPDDQGGSASGNGSTNGANNGIPNGYIAYVNPATSEPIDGLYIGPGGGLFRWDPETQQMTPININPGGGR